MMITKQKDTIFRCLILVLLYSFTLCTSATAWFSDKTETKKEEKKLPAEYVKLNEQLVEARESYDQLAAQVDAAINTAKKKLLKRKNDKAALETEIAATDKAISTLRQINEERYIELEKQQKKLEDIEQILATKSTRIQELANAVQAEKAIQKEESKAHALETKLQQIEIQTQELKDKHAEALATLNTKVEQLTSEKKAQSKEMTQLRRNLTRTRNRLDSAHLNNNELSFEVQELKDAVASYEQEKETAIKGVSSSLQEFEKFISESR